MWSSSFIVFKASSDMHQVIDLSRSSIDVVSAMAIMAEPRRGGMTLRPIRLVRLISGLNFLMANLNPP